MALTYTNTQLVTDAIGKIRDVSKQINNLDKDETPVLTMIGQGKKATSDFTEWERRSFPVYSADAAAQEGKLAAPEATTQPEMLGNHQMTVEVSASVSTKAQATKQYNINNKLADQIRLKTTGKKIALNKRILGNYASVASASGNSNTGKFAGMLAWMEGSNVTRGATGSDGGFGNTTAGIVDAYGAGTAYALTETLFLACIENIAGGRKKTNYDAFVNASLRSAVSAKFTGIASLTQDVSAKTDNIGLAGSVGYMRTDFGIVRFHYDHTAKTDALVIINKDLWKMRTMEPWSSQDLATTGLAKAKQVWTTTTLESTNANGSGALVDLSG